LTVLLRLSVFSVTAIAALLVFASDTSAQVSPATDLMSEANARYQRGEYAEAAQQYEALVGMGYEDTSIYYNLGNTYFEMGDLGRAILNYLRAQELSPRNPDILAQLDLARGRVVDQVGVERASLVESVSSFGHRWVTTAELGSLSLLLWAISCLAASTLLVFRSIPFKFVLRSGAVLLGIVTSASFLLLLSMLYFNPYHHIGVVTAELVEVVSGPGPQYTREFTLYSGAELRLGKSTERWLQVSLPGGELQGWAPWNAIESVGQTSAEKYRRSK